MSTAAAPAHPGALVRLLRLEGKRVFSTLYFWILAGIAAYFGLLALWNYFSEPGDRYGTSDVLNEVIALPILILALYLGSRVIMGEQEDRTLETLFTLPGSKLTLWLVKLGVLHTALYGGILVLTVLSYLFMAEFPLFRTSLHAMVPVLFFGHLALLLSLVFRSSNAAGMVAFLVVAFFFFTQGIWTRPPLWVIYPFLNPLSPPEGFRSMDPRDWYMVVVENRVLVLFLSGLWLLFALLLLRRRERYL